MGEPITFQEQEATTSTVTVVESDEQVCKHVLLRTFQTNIKVNTLFKNSFNNVSSLSLHILRV